MWQQTMAAAALVALFVWAVPAGVMASSGSGDVIDHAPFGEVLDEYVDDGNVDYAGLYDDEDARETLEEYVRQIGEANARGHTRQAVMAFLINAYNALVIADVIERWPVETVMDEEGFFDGTHHRVARANMTLDQLDKTYIRKRYSDPRVNYVLVCAAKSCPPLRSDPLTERTIERVLDEARAAYLASAVQLTDEGHVETSQLFKWYNEEFEQASGSVRDYLAEHIDDERISQALQQGAQVVFREYDWSLNSP